MANTFLDTGRTTGIASSNPQQNIEQLNSQTTAQPVQNNFNTNTGVGQAQQSQQGQISPITIPIQIQPQVATAGQMQTVSTNPNSNLQTYNNQSQAQGGSIKTPQNYQGTQQPNNVVDFNQIYSAYNQAVGNQNTNATTSGIKKTPLGTTIVTPTVSNLNTVQGQYQSAYADTINGLISEMLNQMNNGFSYDPTQDNALKMASEYAANSTLQSLAGSGVLNSSATAERVARIVSELIPQYEEKAHNRWIEYLGQLSNTAQIVMNYDSQQFQYWKDAKDREFEEKQFDYQKQQDALDNAWKRVDELGYVDNNASTILGVPVGTLSGEARQAKEEREFQLQKMREQAEIEFENTKALYKIRSDLDIEQSKAISINEYELARKYGSSSTSSNTTSLSTYKDIINNRFADYDDFSKKYTISDNTSLYEYLTDEYNSGRLSADNLKTLISYYGVREPFSSSAVEDIYNKLKIEYDNTAKQISSSAGKQRMNDITANYINTLYQNKKITANDVRLLLNSFNIS